MYDDGDFTKDEWRAQNDMIRNEHQLLSAQKVKSGFFTTHTIR